MEKRFKKGLVLGKFLPPHLGHCHLIDSASKQCDILYVMVCSLVSEPIHGLSRYMWLKELYNNNDSIIIIHCQDENPQKPEECPSTDDFYNNYWLPSVNSRIDNLEAVFTSEEYGEEFASYLNVEHVLVDIDRVVFPVSGTKIRNNPFQYWDFIPTIIKPYFTKRIAIMGPESTGKTILTKNLAKHYDTDYVEEYGRLYSETIKPAKDFTVDDYYIIAIEQDKQILEKHTDTTHKVLFIDTESITTKLFGEMYINDYYDDRVENIIKYQLFDLYILLDIDIPWVDDGTRDFSDESDRKKHFNKIKGELDKLGKNYIVIGGDYDNRFNKSVEIINNTFFM